MACVTNVSMDVFDWIGSKAMLFVPRWVCIYSFASFRHLTRHVAFYCRIPKISECHRPWEIYRSPFVVLLTCNINKDEHQRPQHWPERCSQPSSAAPTEVTIVSQPPDRELGRCREQQLQQPHKRWCSSRNCRGGSGTGSGANEQHKGCQQQQ